MKIRAVDFIFLPVSDLAAAASFYREVLGLKQEVYSDEHQWAEFNCGNVTLALKGGACPEEVSSGSARIALAVADIDNVYAELKAKRVAIGAPPVDHGFCRHLDVTDPAGHRLILHQRADGTCG